MSSKREYEKVKKVLKKFGAESVEKLMELADNSDTPPKLKADILKWFAEMEFGKPTSKQTTDLDVTGDVVTLEGELDKWSE